MAMAMAITPIIYPLWDAPTPQSDSKFHGLKAPSARLIEVPPTVKKNKHNMARTNTHTCLRHGNQYS